MHCAVESGACVCLCFAIEGDEPFAMHVAADYLVQLADGTFPRSPLASIGALAP